MKASDLRNMTRRELSNLLSDLIKEKLNLIIRKKRESIPNPLRLRTIRRDIARILTILKEDNLGLRSLPKEEKHE